MKQHDHLSSKEEIDNIKLWEINYASLVHTLLKGISEEEYEEMRSLHRPLRGTHRSRMRHEGQTRFSA